jgi:hypothetical protein
MADMPRRQKYNSSFLLPWYFQCVRIAVEIAITIPYSECQTLSIQYG